MTIRTEPRDWRRYAALGDSFTEGLSDTVTPSGRHRGWADRLAEDLAAQAGVQGDTGISYANLAIRGRLVAQVVAEQVPAAIELSPDLTSVAVGVNDALRRHFDLNAAATDLENGVRALRAAHSDVLLFAFGDPSRRSSVMARVKDRIRGYNDAVEAIADEYDCYLVRYWDVAAMDDDRLWSADRLHLSPVGHRLAADSALAALGLADDTWRTPLVPEPAPGLLARGSGHVAWGVGHLGPWIVRRARGVSSGDGITPKHAEWAWIDRPQPVS